MTPLLIANYSFVLGGGEIGLRMRAEELSVRGHRPIVAVPGTIGLFDGLDQRAIAAELPAGALGVRDLAPECDVIHCYSVRSALMAVLAGTSRPLVLHALVPDRDPYDPVVSHLADLILCNSHATASRFPPPAHPNVVYNGVRHPRPRDRPLSLRPGRRTIGVIGNTCPRKGQLDALPALERVLAARADVDVAFVGRVVGPVGLALKERAESSEGRLRLLGFVPDVADHLDGCAMVLVPSRSEGFGRVAVEAMRAGTPVLATRVEGLVEALQDLRDPWLPARREDWAARIIRELDEPSHSPSELRAGAERFDPARHVETILSWYDRLLQPKERATTRAPLRAD
jgi:glycosyltransferase involved in cell wall biosynthesis